MMIMRRCRVLLLLVLLVESLVVRAEDLTTSPWLVTAADIAGRPWSSSLLTFTEQVPDESGFKLSGYFDWFLSGVPQGREMVRGTMSASGAIDLAGYELVNPGSILLDVYRARLSVDGTEIVNGTFGVPEGVAGVWSAKRTLQLTPRLVSPEQLELCWDTGTNFWYQLQYRADAGRDAWIPVNGPPTQGSGHQECASLPILADQSQRFYQIVQTNSPPVLSAP